MIPLISTIRSDGSAKCSASQPVSANKRARGSFGSTFSPFTCPEPIRSSSLCQASHLPTLTSIRDPACHSEPFVCHAERSEASQGKLLEESPLRMTSEPRVLSDCNELGEPLEWMRQRVGMRRGSTVVLAEEDGHVLCRV